MPDTRYEHNILHDRFQVFVPDGYEGRPTTAKELLERAKALLQAEGRWITGLWFLNEHPDVDPEDPFCNNWGVCMDGALIAVDVGMRAQRWAHGISWSCPSDLVKDGGLISGAYIDAPLLLEARELLVEAGALIWPVIEQELRRNYDVSKWDYFEKAGGSSFAEAYTHETYPPFQMYVPNFNDKACQTRTQAIEWLDKAIDLASVSEQEQSDSAV